MNEKIINKIKLKFFIFIIGILHTRNTIFIIAKTFLITEETRIFS